MQYETKVEKIKIGDFDFSIEMIKDLDQAIDEICASLEKEGKSNDVFAADLCPYFGVLWPSGVALAEHLSRMGEWLRGKTVLELGCGLALPSIVAAKKGALVTACDFHPDVENFLKLNCKQNQVQVQYMKKHWEENLTEKDKTYDFVIASDVLYEKAHPQSMAKALQHYCKKQGHILLSDPGRSYLQNFTQELEAHGFRHDLFIRDAFGFNRSGVREEKQVFLLAFQR